MSNLQPIHTCMVCKKNPPLSVSQFYHRLPSLGKSHHTSTLACVNTTHNHARLFKSIVLLYFPFNVTFPDPRKHQSSPHLTNRNHTLAQPTRSPPTLITPSPILAYSSQLTNSCLTKLLTLASNVAEIRPIVRLAILGANPLRPPRNTKF